jgi:hypothetical protein
MSTFQFLKVQSFRADEDQLTFIVVSEVALPVILAGGLAGFGRVLEYDDHEEYRLLASLFTHTIETLNL